MGKEHIAMLVALTRQGHEGAQEDLVKETYQSGYFIALKVLKNPNDAQDILQDSYLTAFTKLEQLKKDGSFVSWFHTIVMNKCRDYLRKMKPILFVELQNDNFSADIEFEDENIEFQPDEQQDYSETQRLMEEILDSLPEDQRICTLMFYYDEMSITEIASALDVSDNTIKSRLRYARMKIETEVLGLETKTGVKLYSTTVAVPFFVWMLKNMEAGVAAPIGAVETTVSAVTNVSVEATTAITGASSGSSITSGAVATGTKVAGSIAVSKIIAGVVAVLVVAGGTIGGVAAYQSTKAKEQEIQALQKAIMALENEKNSDSHSSNELPFEEGSLAADVDSTTDNPAELQSLSFNREDVFVYDFQGFEMYFPKALEQNLEFKEVQADGDWLWRLDINYIPKDGSSTSPLIAQIGYDYADNEPALLARYDSTFTKASDSEVISWGVVDTSTTVWDKVGLYPLAFRAIAGTPYYIEWNAKDFMNRGDVVESDAHYEEFMQAKRLLRDSLYYMHLNRDVVDVSVSSQEYIYEDIYGFQIPFPKELEGKYELREGNFEGNNYIQVFGIGMANFAHTYGFPYIEGDWGYEETGYVCTFSVEDNFFETPESPLKDKSLWENYFPFGESPGGMYIVTGNKRHILYQHNPSDATGSYPGFFGHDKIKELENPSDYVEWLEWRELDTWARDWSFQWGMRENFLGKYPEYSEYKAYTEKR